MSTPPWCPRQLLLLSLFLPLSLASLAQFKFDAQNINSTLLWSNCGYYGLDYKVTCTDEVSAYISFSQSCVALDYSTSLDISCPEAPAYKSLSCSHSKWCIGRSFETNSLSLCLVVTKVSNSSSSIQCDISITGESEPISKPATDGLAWPVWQIVVVAVGGAVVVFLAVALCILLWVVNTRGAATIAPENEDPFEMTYMKATQAAQAHGRPLPHSVQNSPSQLFRGGAPPWSVPTSPPAADALTPAKYPWPPPHNSTMYTAAPRAAPVSHMLPMPTHYYNRQVPPRDD